MGFLSILPESLAVIESWLIRVFLLLAILTIGPWLLLLVYDVLLYLWRSATYELQGRQGRRPRAPSLTERPSGHKRRFSLAGLPKRQSDTDETATASSGYKRRSHPTMPRISNDVGDDG